MKPNSILIIGCGDLGERVAGLLNPSGFSIGGICRHPEQLSPLFTGRYHADYTLPGSLAFLEELAPDYVLTTFKPAQASPKGYQAGFPEAMDNLLTGLGAHRPKGIFMVSSTRALAEQKGAWVDEQSAAAESGYAARAIVEAEKRLQASGLRACIVRFAGIYGDRNGRLLSRVRGGEIRAEQPACYGNRIHRNDCAGMLVHLLNLDHCERAPLYLGVDNEPAPQHEVERWLANEMGVNALPVEQAPRGHKRCSNRLITASGYRFLYPSYREGYRAVMAP
ncbi:MAG: NAD(P)H-binding protein [Halioglobus sp.]